jgi:nucleoside-diphosphate-sugar epimerase|tara:strand:- start:2816 stop:3772 length:957 start_codon:yes stop_codon:yes gene_type:complete
MKLLMTGGLGFLGSYSIEKYKSEGFDITIIDNLSSNVIEPDDELCKDCHVIIDDILNISWSELEDNFDVILHLASPVGPVGVLKHSGEMARYILDDIYWAIDGAKKYDCPLIFISTSEIYGYREKAEFLKESDDKLLVGDFKVRNEYSMGKLLAEIVLSNTAKVSNLKYQIIRPFNISGPRQLKDGGFVLPTFTQQALKDEPITVFGDGSQIRAFTYVKDIVDGIYLTSVANNHMNEIWNIGNGDNVATIKHMAEKVKEFTKSNSEVTFVDPKTIHGPLFEEAWDKIPDSEKIRDLLGWAPTLGVDEIIESVINFWRK